MKRFLCCMTFGLGLIAPGCGGSGGGPVEPVLPPALGFTILAPREIDTKKLVEIGVRVDVAQSVLYPLQVTMEKANVNQAFFLDGALSLLSPDQREVTFRVPIAMDPQLRITVSEADPEGFRVSKAIKIDVLDFTGIPPDGDPDR